MIKKDVELDQATGDVRWGSDHQFSNRDRNLALLLGIGYVALISRRPYVGFTEFMKFAEPTWKNFVECAAGPELIQVRLSYYNVVEIPDVNQNLARYLNGGFYISPKVEATKWPVEHMKSDALFQLDGERSVRLTSGITGGNSPFITLNLEMISNQVDGTDLASWCRESHDVLSELFEDFCTDELKNTFEPDE